MGEAISEGDAGLPGEMQRVNCREGVQRPSYKTIRPSSKKMQLVTVGHLLLMLAYLLGKSTTKSPSVHRRNQTSVIR